MFILCDTCSVLMLIRIAPKMFNEKEYECLTVKEVHQEIKRTQKFKEKYQWRIDFLPEIKMENLKNCCPCVRCVAILLRTQNIVWISYRMPLFGHQAM